jgi:hypothetical protein
VLLFCDSFLCVWYFSTVLPNFYLWGIEWCAALLWSLSLRLVKVFSTVPTQFLPESRSWVMCCSLWFRFFCLVLRVFFNSPTFYLWKQDWVMCCSFVIPFFVFGLKYFFQQLQFLPMKAGIGDVLLLCDSFFTFGLRVFSTVLPNSHL